MTNEPREAREQTDPPHRSTSKASPRSVLHRERLRRLVRLRLNHRLLGRVNPSDILQETFLEIADRAAEYIANPTVPPFLWLRFLTAQKLMGMHRRHLGAQLRDAGQSARPSAWQHHPAY